MFITAFWQLRWLTASLAILLASTFLIYSTPVLASSHLPPAKNLTATPGNAQVTLQWQLNTEPDVVGYRLYLSLDPNNFNSFLDLDLVAQHRDTGLKNGTTYHYALTTRNSQDEEGPRATIQVTPGVQINIPVTTATTDTFRTVNSPLGGIYRQPQTVVLSNSDPSVIIFYTTDGTDPQLDFTNPAVKTYTGPITISQSAILKFSARSAQSGKIETTKTSQYIIKDGAGSDIVFPVTPDGSSVQPGTPLPPVPPSATPSPAAPHPAASALPKQLSLAAQPSTLEVGEENRSQLTAELLDGAGTALGGAVIDFELSPGDGGKALGSLSTTSVTTDQTGRARVEYLASRFAGTTIVTTTSKTDPVTSQKVTITQKPGAVASIDLPLRALTDGQDNQVNISAWDRFQNPVADNTVVLLSLTVKGTQQTESFRSQTKNGVAVVTIPANTIKAKEYQAVASAGGIQSQIVQVTVGKLSKLQDSGPETELIFWLTLLGGLLAWTYRYLRPVFILG